MHDPNLDGVDHINVYSKGKTLLGQLLSNFAYSPFCHPEHGEFNSVEAFYYWLSTGKKYHRLCCLSGHAAKFHGSKLPREHCDNFEEEIKLAIKLKIEHSELIKYAQSTANELCAFNIVNI